MKLSEKRCGTSQSETPRFDFGSRNTLCASACRSRFDTIVSIDFDHVYDASANTPWLNRFSSLNCPE